MAMAHHILMPVVRRTHVSPLQGHGPRGIHSGGEQQEPGPADRPGPAAAGPDRGAGAVGHLQPVRSPEVSWG